MEGNSSITKSYQRVTENSIGNKKACQPVRGLTLQGRTVEKDKVFESTEESSDNGSYHSAYFCTFCDVYEDKDLLRWQLHEYHVHQKSRHLKCPECFALEYDNTLSTQHDHLNSHEQSNSWPENSYYTNEHIQETCKHAATIGRKSYKQNFWGCGFCDEEKTTPMQSWQERCSHVARHMRRGESRNDWVFTNLIKVLLGQPAISELWNSYIHSLHGPNVKDRPEFHWIGTNGLCQKVLRELEIGLHSANEQIQLVKMAYIMGANESSHPVDSLFSANWSFSPRDQSIESSCSSCESEAMSKNRSENDCVTGVRTERTLQHESFTRMNNRKHHAKPSYSIRGIVSVKFFIRKLRRLLPRESTKRREVEKFAGPRFRKSDWPRCSSPVSSGIDEPQSGETDAYKEDLRPAFKPDDISSGSLSSCYNSKFFTTNYQSFSETFGSDIGQSEAERQFSKQTLPNDVGKFLTPAHQSTSTLETGPVSLGATASSNFARTKPDYSGSNFRRELRSSGKENPPRSKGSINHCNEKITGRNASRSYSGRTDFPQLQVIVESSPYSEPPDALLSRATFVPCASSSSLVGDSSVSLESFSRNFSKPATLESPRYERCGKRSSSPGKASLGTQPDFTFQDLYGGTSNPLPATGSSLFEVLDNLDGDDDFSSIKDSQLLRYSPQQQIKTINPAVLSIANTNTAASASTGLNGAIHNRQKFSYEGIGYYVPQAAAVIDQTGADVRRRLALGQLSENNPLMFPRSSAIRPSSLSVPDSSSVANSEIAIRKETLPLVVSEPLQTNSLLPSKKRSSSAIGSFTTDVPDSCSGANVRSSHFALSNKYGDEKLKKRQRTNSDTAEDDEGKRKLACPYYLRHPKKYMEERSCPGPGWDSVHRLKAHLYTSHVKPIQCFRCSQCFRSEEERNIHQRIAEACVMRPLCIADGMSEEQMKRVKRKTRARTEEDKWRGIWKILFPMDAEADIPKPYYPIHSSFGVQAAQSTKSPSDCDFEEFLGKGFRDKVTQKIEMALKEKEDFIEDKIKKHVIKIVHECTTELFQEFREWKNGNVSNKTSEVDTCQKEVSQIDSAPTLSTGLSSDVGVLNGKKTPTQSPRPEQDGIAGEDYLHGLNIGSFLDTECWPDTLVIDSELNVGAQCYVAGFTDNPALSMAGPEEGESLTMSKIEGKQRMYP